ncbi:MAG: hypothetical protein NTW56_07535 [Alphaproteobacteria bacterium]|nr:hypothetical protein [Alphaproteobacteria bacterium]
MGAEIVFKGISGVPGFENSTFVDGGQQTTIWYVSTSIFEFIFSVLYEMIVPIEEMPVFAEICRNSCGYFHDEFFPNLPEFGDPVIEPFLVFGDLPDHEQQKFALGVNQLLRSLHDETLSIPKLNWKAKKLELEKDINRLNVLVNSYIKTI